MKVAIVAEHASARFGGEAALPLHYFRVLQRRGVPVWLITHERTRDELSMLYPGNDRILYVPDTRLHRALWRIGGMLPDAISYFTTGYLSRLSSQWVQRRIVKRLVAEHAVTVVHQPMPVSPREPSALFGFDVPVVIGPMNGGMEYPPAFQRRRGFVEQFLLKLARSSAALMNLLLPGKRRADLLLVANSRTRRALPAGASKRVVELVENGVDFDLWEGALAERSRGGPTRFVFMGRLVAWKSVDLLLRAFASARHRSAMELWILGDGDEREALERLATHLGIHSSDARAAIDSGQVRFEGWLSQADCAARLRQADVLVLPSLLECGGAVVLEAMALAKPVVATAWGGPLDYLDSGCGILIEPTSADLLVDGFASAMTQLAGSTELRLELGKRGREKALREFDWERKVDRMIELYADVSSRHRGA